MADALRTDGEGLPDGLGAGGFAGVVGEAQARFACLGIEGAKGRGAGAALVATQSYADDGGVSGLEFSALAGSLQGGEDGLEGGWVVVAPAIDDADGDIDLGVDHALCGQVLH